MPARANLLIFIALASSCGPRPSAQVRLVNASARAMPIDVSWSGSPAFREVRHGEATSFEALEAGLSTVQAFETSSGQQLGTAGIDVPAAARATVILAPRADPLRFDFHRLVHGFESPTPGLIRLRVLNAAALGPVTVDLNDGQLGAASLGPGEDTGPAGLQAPANEASRLLVRSANEVFHFTVPALPSQSELVLVLANAQDTQVAMLGVALSATLGFMWPEGVPP